MTDREINEKINKIKLSDAHIEIREKAIKELEYKLSTHSSINVARQQFIESAADISDIGNN